jgi:hypothetical protein
MWTIPFIATLLLGPGTAPQSVSSEDVERAITTASEIMSAVTTLDEPEPGPEPEGIPCWDIWYDDATGICHAELCGENGCYGDAIAEETSGFGCGVAEAGVYLITGYGNC